MSDGNGPKKSSTPYLKDDPSRRSQKSSAGVGGGWADSYPASFLDPRKGLGCLKRAIVEKLLKRRSADPLIAARENDHPDLSSSNVSSQRALTDLKFLGNLWDCHEFVHDPRLVDLPRRFPENLSPTFPDAEQPRMIKNDHQRPPGKIRQETSAEPLFIGLKEGNAPLEEERP